MSKSTMTLATLGAFALGLSVAHAGEAPRPEYGTPVTIDQAKKIAAGVIAAMLTPAGATPAIAAPTVPAAPAVPAVPAVPATTTVTTAPTGGPGVPAPGTGPAGRGPSWEVQEIVYGDLTESMLTDAHELDPSTLPPAAEIDELTPEAVEEVLGAAVTCEVFHPVPGVADGSGGFEIGGEHIALFGGELGDLRCTSKIIHREPAAEIDVAHPNACFSIDSHQTVEKHP